MDTAKRQRAMTLEIIKQAQRWAVKVGDCDAFAKLSRLYVTSCTLHNEQSLEVIYSQVQNLSYGLEDMYIDQQRRAAKNIRRL